ncbi:MAG: GldG family protein [Clostridia bacterium]|nr:GldG family protein [Clostridia bacterium]
MKENKNMPVETSKPAKKPSALRAFLEGRKLRYGLVTVILALVLVVLVITTQVAIGELSERVGLSVDLTANQMYSMSEDTIKFVEDIDKDVEIVILASEYAYDIVAPQHLEIIKKYAQINDKISVSFVDVNYNPSYISGYDEIIEYGDILVKCGARYKIVEYAAMVLEEETEDEDVVIEYSNAEDEMNSALVYVTSTQTFKAAFTTGHGEYEGKVLKSYMQRNNFQVEDVDLTQKTDLSEYNLVISLGPTLDFKDDELFTLDAFLDNKGKLDKSFIYMPSVERDPSPNLDEFLKEWGIVVTDEIVYQTDSSLVYSTIFDTYATVPSTEQELGGVYASKVPGKEYKLYLPYSRNIITSFENMGSRSTRAFLQFTGGAKLSNFLTLGEEETWTASASDPSGIFNAGVVGYDSRNGAISHVMVLGNNAIASDAAINTGDFINSKYLIQILNAWVDKPVNDVIVEPVDITRPIFALTEGAAAFAFWFFVVTLPVGTVIAGIVVFVRRRFL